MDKDTLRSLLQLQTDLGRTQKGWDLNSGIDSLSSDSLAKSSEETFSATQCANCGFVAVSEYFASGCPNCGCKDSNPVEMGKIKL